MDGDTNKKRSGILVLQIRLWMLLALFVPIGMISLYLHDRINPKFVYTESKDELFAWPAEKPLKIDFMTLPDGSPLGRGHNINSAFAAIGISFEAESAITKLKPVEGSRGIPDFIGISGYGFKFANARFPNSIAPFIHAGSSISKRFKGRTIIRFHKPGDANRSTNVHRVGFYAARLDTPETLQVKLFSDDGELIGQASNLNNPCAFMGFQTRYNIGRIEIETIGDDDDYAIAGLVLTKPH